MRSGFHHATDHGYVRLITLVGIALTLLLFTSFARFRPAASLSSATPAKLSLAEAQAIVQEVSRATQIRWFETKSGRIEVWQAEYTITPRDYRLVGELWGRNNVPGIKVTLPLEAESDPLDAFLSDVAALPIGVGPQFGHKGTHDSTNTVVELITPQGVVFFECLELHEDCISWNVYIASQHPTYDRFPQRSFGTHFLFTGPELRDSLGRLHEALGVAAVRERLMARR